MTEKKYACSNEAKLLMYPQQEAALGSVAGEVVAWCWSMDILSLGGEMVARVSAGHAWRRLNLTTFSGGLKIPQETQISPWLTSERSTRCGHEHRNDVGKILSVLVHHVQQPANSTVAFSARQCLQMPNISVKFCQNG